MVTGGEIRRAVLPFILALGMGSVAEGCAQKDQGADAQSSDFTSGFCVETNEAGEVTGYFGPGTFNSQGEVCQEGKFEATSPVQEVRPAVEPPIQPTASPAPPTQPSPTSYPTAMPSTREGQQVVFQITNMEKPGAQSGQRGTEYLWYAIGAAAIIALAGSFSTHQNSSRR